jgi:hypothetical protein
MRASIIAAALLFAAGAPPALGTTHNEATTFQWSGTAQWIAFTIAHRDAVATVHYTVDLDCGTKLACFINNLFYGDMGEFGGNGQEGGVDSTIGEQTSVQVAGHHVFNTERPPLGDDQPRNVASIIDLTLSQARGNGNWTTIAILAAWPASISLTIDPPTSLFDFKIGQSGVKKIFAHDFSATADLMQSGFALGEGAAAGLDYNATVRSQQGMLGRFDPWSWGAKTLLFQDLRAGGFTGPDGESGQCMDQTYLVISFGGCVGFVLHGGPGDWNMTALHRVCDCPTDEVWVVFVDTQPPSVPP